MGLLFIVTSNLFTSEIKIPEISSDSVLQKNNNKLVYTKGSIASEELNDPMFNISSKGISLERIVEMYQWVEEKGEHTKKWHTEIINIASNKDISNPPEMPFFSEKWNTDKIRIGKFDLSDQLINNINVPKKLPVTNEHFQLLNEHGKQAFKLHNGSYFFGINPKKPRIGDLRVTFKVVNPKTVTVLAKQSGSMLTRFIGENGTIEKIMLGEHTVDSISQNLDLSGNSTNTWFARAIGAIFLIFSAFLFFRKSSDTNQMKNSNYTNDFDDIDSFTPQSNIASAEDSTEQPNHYNNTENNSDIEHNEEDLQNIDFIDDNENEESNANLQNIDYINNDEQVDNVDYISDDDSNEINNVTSEIDNNDEQVDNIDYISDDDSNETNNVTSEIDNNDEQVDNIDYISDDDSNETNNVTSEIDNNDEQVDNIDYISDDDSNETNNVTSEIDNNDEQVDNIDYISDDDSNEINNVTSEIDNNDEQVDNIDYISDDDSNEINNVTSEIDNNDEQVENVDYISDDEYEIDEDNFDIESNDDDLEGFTLEEEDDDDDNDNDNDNDNDKSIELQNDEAHNKINNVEEISDLIQTVHESDSATNTNDKETLLNEDIISPVDTEDSDELQIEEEIEAEENIETKKSEPISVPIPPPPTPNKQNLQHDNDLSDEQNTLGSSSQGKTEQSNSEEMPNYEQDSPFAPKDDEEIIFTPDDIPPFYSENESEDSDNIIPNDDSK